MSCGFQRHPAFEVVAAADAEIGKPSSPRGALGCNASYAINVGVAPQRIDLADVAPERLAELLDLRSSPVVLAACSPCTGFSRTLSQNHLVDDTRNSLVGKVAEFARVLEPTIVVMENARELLMGRFSSHFEDLRSRLRAQGYRVHARIHFLSEFGLPQRRERALVIATKDTPLYGLDDLWAGYAVRPEATHVRHAIGHLAPLAAGDIDLMDAMHTSPRFISQATRSRLQAIPHDGGSWFDLLEHPRAAKLLTPGMRRRAAARAFGSHPDVYGRLAWDRPAATIKRECSHIGNGRYAHPEQDRLCSVRELALLQGFPEDYQFSATSLSNMYRHVGDAVPPMISYQVAALTNWMLGGERPGPEQFVLPGCSLMLSDIVER